MAQCEQQLHADGRPNFAFAALKVLIFVAPIVAATVLTMWSAPKEMPATEEDGLAMLQCGTEKTWRNDAAQSVLSLAFFDTSWLPDLDDFVAITGGSVRTARLWNPLANAWLTSEQVELLSLAYKIGYDDGGPAHAKLLQAVLMQETIAGQLGRLGHLSAPLGKRSYGVMQVKVIAARDVLAWKPEFAEALTEEHLIARLIADDEFNLKVASAYLKYLRKNSDSDHQALVAYNLGPNGAKQIMDPTQYRYVLSVERYLANVVLPFNGKFLGGGGRITSM